MSKSKRFDKELSRHLKGKNLSTSKSLEIILRKLRRKGQLRSCMLTDNTGLVLSEVVHRRDEKENIAAACALLSDTSERISDYLKTSPVELSFFVTNSHLVWTLPFSIPKSKEKYILISLKPKTIADTMSKSTLELLDKDKTSVTSLMAIASKWMIRVFKN